MFDVLQSFLNDKFSTDDDTVLSVFKAFDQDNDDTLDDREFEQFLKQLFIKNAEGYALTRQQVQDLRYLVDLNQSGVVSLPEFSLFWAHCVKSILSPKTALILVDLQNDHADKLPSDTKSVLFSNLNDLTDRHFGICVFSLESFPVYHVSFLENFPHHSHKIVQYPRHDKQVKLGDYVTLQMDGKQSKVRLRNRECVEKTSGADIVNHVTIPKNSFRAYKGTDASVDSYSAFRDASSGGRDTGLLKMLRNKEITDVYIAGIGLGSGVAATALDSVRHGFRTVLVWDSCCDVTSGGGDPTDTFSLLSTLGVTTVMTEEVENMLNCSNRRPELGYVSVLNYAIALKTLATQSSRKARLESEA